MIRHVRAGIPNMAKVEDPTAHIKTLDELNQSAKVILDKSFSLRPYYGTVKRMVESAKDAERLSQFKKSYWLYMRICSITVDVIPKHPEFRKTDKDPEYLQVLEICRFAIERCEKLKQNVIEELEAFPAPSSSPKDQVVPSTTSRTVQSPISIAPRKNSLAHLNTFLERLPPSSTSSIGGGSGKIMEGEEGSPLPLKPPPMSLSQVLDRLAKDGKISPTQLLRLVSLKQQNAPKVLVLDLRDRGIFLAGHVKCSNIINMEPLILQRVDSAIAIADSLILHPSCAEFDFKNRAQFDLVVFYDENDTNSARDSPAGVALLRALEVDVVPLKRNPVVMLGGYQTWKQINGDEWCAVGDEEGENSQGKIEEANWASRLSRSTAIKRPSKVAGLDQQQVVNRAMGPSLAKSVIDYFNPNAIQEEKLEIIKETMAIIAETPTTIPSAEVIEKIENVTQKMDDKPKVDPEKQRKSLRRQASIFDNPYAGFTEIRTKDATGEAIATILRHPPPPKRKVPLLPERRPSPGPTKAYKLAKNWSAAEMKQQLLAQIRQATSKTGGKENLTGVPKSHLTPMFPGRLSKISSGDSVGICGLKNLGNTCFMNSILQCLSGTFPISRFFIDGSYKRFINVHNPLSSKGNIADAFAEVMRMMNSGQFPVVNPSSFKQVLGSYTPSFEGYDQQDSQEFLAYLLDALHEDLNQISTESRPELDFPDDEFEELPDDVASQVAWEKYCIRNSSIVVSMFQGQLRSRLQCKTCDKTSTTYNAFMFLTLPIPSTAWNSKSVPLERCIDLFLQGEILSGDNAWKCPRCQTFRKASKKTALTRLPDVLMIHLKRFSFQGPFREKLETEVTFPRKLDLKPYLPFKSGTEYDLYAISNHYGGLNGGHYTASVRNMFRGQWYLFDDSRVSESEDVQVNRGIITNTDENE